MYLPMRLRYGVFFLDSNIVLILKIDMNYAGYIVPASGESIQNSYLHRSTNTTLIILYKYIKSPAFNMWFLHV